MKKEYPRTMKEAREVCALIALSGGGYVSPAKLLKMTKDEFDNMLSEIRNARKQGIRKSWLTIS